MAVHDRIIIRDLLLRGIIGLNDWEREKQQDILINLVIYTDMRNAGRSDDMSDSINYRSLTKDIIAHVHKRMKASRGFRKLLMLVALREASYQSGLVHRLQPDIEGSHSAWRKMKDRYPDNPYAEDPNLWQTYGLFGMNSNYFTMLWSKQADPRVLCDPIVDVLVYRRAAERALRKLNGTIKCKNADGETYDFRTTPTWATIHRAVNGGKLCPSKHENQAAIMRKYFNARAIKKGLDADERVTSKMLGVEPDRGLDGEVWETQEEMVMGLWEEFEALAEES